MFNYNRPCESWEIGGFLPPYFTFNPPKKFSKINDLKNDLTCYKNIDILYM